MYYPATFSEAAEGGYVVTFRDIPEAITQGDSEAEAMEMAEDVLLSSMEIYLEERRSVPPPSAFEEGEKAVHLPASAAAKVLLLNEQLAQGVSNAELARRMGTRPQEVVRITNLAHATKIDTIERALRALGRGLTLATE